VSHLFRLVIVDDHAVFRETLARALQAEPDLEVIADHASVAGAVRTLSQESADLVLLDFDLGAERGSALINWAAREKPTLRLLVLTAGLGREDAAWLIQHHVAGIVLKESPYNHLLSVIRTVAQGGNWLDQPILKLVLDSVARGVPMEPDPMVLSGRERDVLRLLVEGCGNKEIAARLSISEVAVKAALQRLFDKTGVRNRGQLIRLALQKYPNLL
jgi:DNA-binding NarL/FixJ family response regulator